MSKPKIGIVVGSVRPNRFADHPTKWIAEIAKNNSELEFEIDHSRLRDRGRAFRRSLRRSAHTLPAGSLRRYP